MAMEMIIERVEQNMHNKYEEHNFIIDIPYEFEQIKDEFVSVYLFDLNVEELGYANQELLIEDILDNINEEHTKFKMLQTSIYNYAEEMDLYRRKGY
ncbi:hypothetical protein BN990_04321 [Virgibacillus salexigens]|uniref:Uncharacterized protein n=3 Tax=Virgibacillus massiliensis TaxID=1462526 RepID=A0A024QI91_9BACI|nr:hypothetical protein BN990_04321 [Virgibacillus massiliensis]